MVDEDVGVVGEREQLAQVPHGGPHGHDREREAREGEGQYRVPAADRERQAQVREQRHDEHRDGLVTQDEEQRAEEYDRQAAVERHAHDLEDDEQHHQRHEEHDDRHGQYFPREGRPYRTVRRVDPLARGGVLEFGADGEDGHHDHEDEQHHGHEARREVIAVIDIGIEQYVPAEPHGHQLRHGLLLAEPLFGEQL